MLLIELEDGAIIDFKTDQDFILGEGTYNYNSKYITDLEITYLNKETDTIRQSLMYDYGKLSLSSVMKVILNHQEDIKKLKECEVAEYLRDELENEQGCYGLKIR
jgi:hypothetical protein